MNIKLSDSDLSVLVGHYTKSLEEARAKVSELTALVTKYAGQSDELGISKPEMAILSTHYTTQLADAKAQVAELESVIARYTGDGAVVEAPTPKAKEEVVVTVSETPAVEKEAPVQVAPKVHKEAKTKKPKGKSTKRKRGVTEKWAEIIKDILARAGEPLIARNIVKIAKETGILNDENYYKDKQAISKALHTMLHVTEELKNYQVHGSARYFYCLPNWFKRDGSMKKQYTRKVDR